MINFNVGDLVCWTSKGGKYEKMKQGKILYEVPANTDPITKFVDKYYLDETYKIMFESFGRQTKGYLVEVTNGTKNKPKLYFPLIKNLKLVNSTNPDDSYLVILKEIKEEIAKLTNILNWKLGQINISIEPSFKNLVKELDKLDFSLLHTLEGKGR